MQPDGTPDSGLTNTCNAGEQDCPDGEQPTHDLSSCALQSITDTSASPIRPGNGVLIGQFLLADGRAAIILHNQNWDATLWPRLEFKAAINPAQVQEVDPVSGLESVVMSDLSRPAHYNRTAPGSRKLTLNLAAAEARLLVWSPHSLKSDDTRAKKWLLVDDLVLNASLPPELEFRVHQPTRALHNGVEGRVVVPEHPWEASGIGAYGSALRTPEGQYRIYYTCTGQAAESVPESASVEGRSEAHPCFGHPTAMLCVAVSSDGVHWEKPSLGRVDYPGHGSSNNIVYGVNRVSAENCPTFEAGTVFVDENVRATRVLECFASL